MNIASVNLNFLLAFEALLEERNVGRAAARIGLSQPAMSNTLRKLRGLFDDVLFTRTRQGMLPTTRALELASPIRDGLGQLRIAMSQSTSFDAALSERSFNLGMTDYAELRVLGPLLGRVVSAAPRMQLCVRRTERIFLAPEDLLRTGAIDLAIGFFPGPNGLDRSLESCDLFTESNLCIGRKGNRLMSRQPFTLQRFAEAGHVGIFYGTERRGLVDDLLAPLGLKRRLTARTPHFLVAPYIVANSDLIAVVPSGLAKYFGRSLPLSIRKVPLRMPPFCMRMLWHKRTIEDPANSWLRAQVLASLSTVSE